MSSSQGLETRMTRHYREGTSDKVYTLQTQRQGRGWLVNVEYGRRGGTMKKDTKTPKPVSWEKAGAIFGELFAEKLANGYTPTAADVSDGGDVEADDEKEATWDHADLGRFTYDGTA